MVLSIGHAVLIGDQVEPHFGLARLMSGRIGDYLVPLVVVVRPGCSQPRLPSHREVALIARTGVEVRAERSAPLINSGHVNSGYADAESGCAVGSLVDRDLRLGSESQRPSYGRH